MTGFIDLYCRSCEHSNHVAFEKQEAITCHNCKKEQALVEPKEAVNEKGQLCHCPACGSGDLFIRKDFNYRIGITAVVVAALLSLWFWSKNTTFHMTMAYVVLGGTVLVDALIFFLLPLFTTCYRCGAFFKDFPVNPEHHGFEHETAARWAYKPVETNLQPMTPPSMADDNKES